MKHSKLYTEKGWLNVDAIASSGSWLNVIIGKRQVGKTYGVLKYMLRENRQHILLRRTVAEVDFLGTAPELSPYEVFKPEFNIGLFKQGKMLNIAEYDVDNGKAFPTVSKGLCVGLPTIASIRGFNGRAYTDIVYDEFIPEKHVIQRKSEGDALLNAYTTINGNRELEGLSPLRLWLLANSNKVDSPILEAFNLTDIVLNMRDKGREVYSADGITVFQPSSGVITEERKQTALMKHLQKESASGEFVKMALENEFAYDDTTLIASMSMKGLQPVASWNNLIYIWKGNDNFYICRTQHNKKSYSSSEFDTSSFAADFGWMFDYYRMGLVKFSDLRVLTVFKKIFKVNF